MVDEDQRARTNVATAIIVPFSTAPWVGRLDHTLSIVDRTGAFCRIERAALVLVAMEKACIMRANHHYLYPAIHKSIAVCCDAARSRKTDGNICRWGREDLCEQSKPPHHELDELEEYPDRCVTSAIETFRELNRSFWMQTLEPGQHGEPLFGHCGRATGRR
jgi:hypothetical protein